MSLRGQLNNPVGYKNHLHHEIQALGPNQDLADIFAAYLVEQSVHLQDMRVRQFCTWHQQTFAPHTIHGYQYLSGEHPASIRKKFYEVKALLAKYI